MNAEAILVTEDRGIGERVVRGELMLPGLIVLRSKGFEIEDRVQRLKTVVDRSRANLLGHLTIIERNRVRVGRL